MNFFTRARVSGLLVIAALGLGCWKVHHDASARADAALAAGSYQLTRVVDGDTLVVRNRNGEIRVRLLGIDAPEKNQPYGSEATAMTVQLVSGQTLQLAPHGHDRYGRVLAHVHAGGTWVDLEMVRCGGAWVYRAQRDDSWPALSEAETAARAAHRGLWALPNPIYPGDWRRR